MFKSVISNTKKSLDWIKSTPSIAALFCSILILCDIFYAFSPFPSILRNLYLINLVLFPVSLVSLALSRSLRYRYKYIIGLLILAALSIPNYTYSKIGFRTYFKIHSKQYESISDFIKTNNVSAIQKIASNSESKGGWRLGMTDGNLINITDVETASAGLKPILDVMTKLNVSYARKRGQIIELKIDGLKRRRMWVIECLHANSPVCSADDFFEISNNQYFHYPKSAPD